MQPHTFTMAGLRALSLFMVRRRHLDPSSRPIRLARLGRPVKKMVGGVEGWNDEGFSLTR